MWSDPEDEKVLRGQPIVFRGRAVEERGRLAVEGELTMAGSTRPLTAELANADGRVAGTITLRQSAWGIKPYRGLMGAQGARRGRDRRRGVP